MSSKSLILFIYFILANVIFSISFKEIKGIERLSNYNELKVKETQRVVDRSNIKRNKKVDRVYVIGEKEPFTGSAIKRENEKIIAISIYINGKLEDNTYDYFNNGQLGLKSPRTHDKIEGLETEYYEDGKMSNKIIYKSSKIIDLTHYDKKGNIIETFKSEDGVKGIRDRTDEKGRRIVSEVTLDYTKKIPIYIHNGKTVVYEKNGKIMGEMNFKNNSIKGLPQKAYKNGKLKYYMVSAKDTPEDFEAQDIYKEYYDNSDQIKYDCDEVSKGSWHCLEYGKNGKMKQEFTTPLYELRKDNSFFWNAVLGVLNILLYGR